MLPQQPVPLKLLWEAMACSRLTAAPQCERSAVHLNACGMQCTMSAAPAVHSHCCDEASATACHPCGCGGVACEYAKIKSGHAHRVVWWLPACQPALRVANACSQARYAVVCKAGEVPCQGAMQLPWRGLWHFNVNVSTSWNQ